MRHGADLGVGPAHLMCILTAPTGAGVTERGASMEQAWSTQEPRQPPLKEPTHAGASHGRHEPRQGCRSTQATRNAPRPLAPASGHVSPPTRRVRAKGATIRTGA